MGKRSSFKRRKNDLYRTFDPRAVRPLIPHLGEGLRYVEPCAGYGDLIRLLEPHATCVQARDIEPKAGTWVGDPERGQCVWIEAGDMMDVEIGDADLFITNPPWTRALLHPLIVHLSDQAPTWLLFDADWKQTQQSTPFMERCRKIVAVGRVRWMPDTKNDGKDNAAWYLFDRPIAGSAPVFYGRGCLPAESRKKARRVCADCGVVIDRFGKWALVERGGLPTPVHKDCARPSSPGQNPELAPTPLLDWGGA